MSRSPASQHAPPPRPPLAISSAPCSPPHSIHHSLHIHPPPSSDLLTLPIHLHIFWPQIEVRLAEALFYSGLPPPLSLWRLAEMHASPAQSPPEPPLNHLADRTLSRATLPS